MATVASVQEALKYGYGVKKVLYLFNQEAPLWACLSKVKKPVGGRGQFIMPATVQNPGGFSGLAEGGTIPSALQPDTTEASFGLQEYVAIYDVTWKLLQDARNDKFAFQQAIQYMEDGLKRRIFRNLNSDLLDDGRGRLAVLPAADDDTTVTVNGLPRLERGMVIDLMDTDDATKNTNSATVTAVDTVNRTVTLSANSGSTGAGDYMVIEDTTDSPVCNHSNGVLGVIDDADPPAVVGDYGGIDRGTAGNEFWEAVVLSNGGSNRPLTEDLLLQALDGAREKGGGKIDKWFSNLAITRRYHEMLRAESFYALSKKPGALGGGLGREAVSPGDAGKSPYEFGGVDWYNDPYFAANTVIGIDTNHLFLGVGENDVPRPISDIFDGVPFFKETTATTFEVVWYYQMELLSDNPAAHVKVEDIAEA
jgi:hypothetical protein